MNRADIKRCTICEKDISDTPGNRKKCFECSPPKESKESRESRELVNFDKQDENRLVKNNKELMKDKKKENRPTISSEKQFFILKEQNYECRGPGPKDNDEYECDMKANGKKFCDKKSPDPQFDHIIRWR